MNFLQKNKSETFLFVDKNNEINAFLIKENQIDSIGFCKIDELDDFLENLRKKYPYIIKNKNLLITDVAKLENLEKGPLTKDELMSYVSWKLKEKIDIPIIDLSYSFIANEKTTIDFFKKNLQTVYIRKNYIQNFEKIFKNHKISLVAFDYTKTAILDFIKKIYEKKNINRPIAILNLEKDNVYLDIYEKDGLILSRNFEFVHVDDVDISELEKKESIEKLVLWIQRSLDYMDRTLALNNFENIIFLGEDKELKNNILNYFSLKEISTDDIEKITVIDSIENHHKLDWNLIKILSYRGKYTEEQINLLEKKEESLLIKDMKNVILFFVLISLLMSIVGGIYEWRAKRIENNIQKIEKQNKKIQSIIEKLKNNKEVISPKLEKEINELTQTKAKIIQMMNQKNDMNNSLFPEFIYQLAFIATKNQMYLSDIEYSQNSLVLKGVSLTKENFQKFLNDLKNSKLFSSIQIQKIQIHENNTQQFDFMISSNKGENK